MQSKNSQDDCEERLQHVSCVLEKTVKNSNKFKPENSGMD